MELVKLDIDGNNITGNITSKVDLGFKLSIIVWITAISIVIASWKYILN